MMEVSRYDISKAAMAVIEVLCMTLNQDWGIKVELWNGCVTHVSCGLGYGHYQTFSIMFNHEIKSFKPVCHTTLSLPRMHKA